MDEAADLDPNEGAGGPGAAPAAEGRPVIRRVLVPLGIAPLGETKLPLAEAFARAFGAEVILLHVLPRQTIDPGGGVSPEAARAHAYLDTVGARMHAAGLRVHHLVRTAPSAAEAILEEAREQQADLIVLGVHVRGRRPGAWGGGVAGRVTRRAPCPVLLVRPDLGTGTGTPLRSFNADEAQRGPLARWPLGGRTVLVAWIVGSVGRADELGVDFRPLHPRRQPRGRAERYQAVYTAMATRKELPPVELYKLGQAYYVLDGHHRVAAALQLGQIELDAVVTEFVPLADAGAQRYFAAQRAFERATGLTHVESVHDPDTYPALQRLVEAYVAAAGPIDPLEGARRWYSRVFWPLAQGIRQRGLLRRFPGERAGDLVVRIAAFRAAESDRLGRALDWLEALELFADAYAPNATRGM